MVYFDYITYADKSQNIWKLKFSLSSSLYTFLLLYMFFIIGFLEAPLPICGLQ